MPRPTRVSTMLLIVRFGAPGLWFSAGWTAVMAVDLVLRLADGDLRVGGLRRDVWFATHAALAITSVAVAWDRWRHVHPMSRGGLIALQVCLGAPLYLLACIAYGIGLGLDGF